MMPRIPEGDSAAAAVRTGPAGENGGEAQEEGVLGILTVTFWQSDGLSFWQSGQVRPLARG